MNYYGTRGTIYNWFKDYLNKRTQFIKIRNNISAPRQLKYDVPHGGVLGPILFLIYVTSLLLIFNKLKLKLFADDSTLYLSGADPAKIINEANTDLDIFYKGCLTNRLTVNLSKTLYMLFTNKTVRLQPLAFDRDIIKRISHHKLLRITIDEALTLKPYI